MNDPLKTFLERARDGGWHEAKHKTSIHPDSPEVIAIIFDPEAAKAVWGDNVINIHVHDSNPFYWGPAYVVRVHAIVEHIFREGDTLLEALNKEL